MDNHETHARINGAACWLDGTSSGASFRRSAKALLMDCALTSGEILGKTLLCGSREEGQRGQTVSQAYRLRGASRPTSPNVSTALELFDSPSF